jgi:hypothetical protein
MQKQNEQNLNTVMKKCSRCGETKNVNEFHRKASTKSGLHSNCKECRKQTDNNKAQQRKYQLKYNYGMTVDDYNDMLQSQNNRCACCGIHKAKIKGLLHVDHCHDTGKVRGLLCVSCNTGLGKFHDDIDLLKDAINYLEKHNEKVID